MAIAAVGGKVACNWTFSRLASIYRAHHVIARLEAGVVQSVDWRGEFTVVADFDVSGLAIKPPW